MVEIPDVVIVDNGTESSQTWYPGTQEIMEEQEAAEGST